MTASAKLLLLDFDGVLRLWPDTDSTLERRHGLADGAIWRAAFAPERLLPALTGHRSDAQWRRSVVDTLAEQYPQARVAEAVAEWSQPVGVVNLALLQRLPTLRSQLRVVLLSNATTRLDNDLAALGIANALDAVINSSSVGVCKPDPAIYRLALNSEAVQPAQALYADDDAGNVAAAQSLGIRSHHYQDLEGFVVFMESAGILC